MILIRKQFSSRNKEAPDISPEIALAGSGVIYYGAKKGKEKTGKKVLQNINKKNVSDEEIEVFKNLLKNNKKRGSKYKIKFDSKEKRNGYVTNKNIIQINSLCPEVLAHEMGHAEFYKNPESGIIGKSVHKLNNLMEGGIVLKEREKKKPVVVNSRILGTNFGYALAAKSGIDKARKEKESKNQGVGERLQGDLTVLGFNLPKITKEFEASRKGLKLIKEAGADKKIMRTARKNLALAGSTYALPVLGKIGISEGIRAISHRAEKEILKHKKKDDN